MLRKIRITAAWIVMGLFLLIFVGGEQVSEAVADRVVFFQFTPSLVKFLLAAGGLVSLGFLVILVLTLLFGRIYCASLCPLGILQDVLTFVRTKCLRSKSGQDVRFPNAGKMPALQNPFFRYGILGLTLASAVLGSFAILNLLDPYSLFGRIATHLFKPVFVFVNNLIGATLELFDIYTVTILAYHHIPLFILGLSCVFLLVLVFLTTIRGRTYCNTVCPVGTLLGLLSHLSLFTITLRQETCISCGICERICRGGCIDSKRKMVDSSRCVVCFDCVSVCPTSAVDYSCALKLSQKQPYNPSRRKLLIGSTSALGSLVLLGIPLRSITKPVLSQGAATPVTPPGSKSIRHFTGTCTACHLCVSACPSKVIHPAFFKYGLRGMMQPELDYYRGSCAYECNACGYVCPTGAITPLPLEEKKLTQIGKATLVKEDCLVHAKDQECGACVEVCPTHAVYTEKRGGILYPELNVDHCIGCGYCQFVCPVESKAIFVEGSEFHGIAKEPLYFEQEPALEITEPQTDDGEEFPF